MNKESLQSLLWFAAGFALATILCISYDAVRFVPLAVAFGLLCFGCGVLFTQFLSLSKQQEEFVKKRLEDAGFWLEKSKEIDSEKSEYEEEKEAWLTEKTDWEEKRNKWEADKKSAVMNEIARISLEEPEILLDFHKSALQLAEDEAARRGGKLIERDMNPDNEEPDKGGSN